ncbi:MAG: hypothetical protein KC912_08705 [Proteobacteria bacterium]|nr:hypothetical protein [Pseudomonadota bacterium]
MKWPIVALLVACSGSPEPEPEPVDGLSLDVAARGPFNPGYRLTTLTYDPGLGEGTRTLDVHIWYPTESADFDEVSYSYEVFTDDQVVPDAALATSAYGGSFPVQVYSHGDRGFGGSSSFLARHFATHGWITIAPDHLDNLTFDTVEPKTTAHFIHRPHDIAESLDLLERDPEFAGLADTAKVVMSGHSFGSYTTWASAGGSYDNIDTFCVDRSCTEAERAEFAAGFDDPRVVATIPMAGTIRRSWLGDNGHSTVDLPVMFMSGTEDPVGQQGQWDAMDSIDFTWLDIEGACHNAFALGSCFTLDTDEGFEIIQTYALAFARRHVLDDDTVSDILDGSTEVSDKVAFQRMNAAE